MKSHDHPPQDTPPVLSIGPNSTDAEFAEFYNLVLPWITSYLNTKIYHYALMQEDKEDITAKALANIAHAVRTKNLSFKNNAQLWEWVGNQVTYHAFIDWARTKARRIESYTPAHPDDPDSASLDTLEMQAHNPSPADNAEFKELQVIIQEIIAKKYSRYELRGYKVLFDTLKYLPRGTKVYQLKYDFGLRAEGVSKIHYRHVLYYFRSLFT